MSLVRFASQPLRVFSLPRVGWMRGCLRFSTGSSPYAPIFLIAASLLALPCVAAQVPSNSLTSSTPPPVSEPGLRERQTSATVTGDVSPDRRGDIFMARKIFRSAIDSYQEALVAITAERASILERSAESLRELQRDSEAKAAESSARDLQRKSKELAAKQQLLPGGGPNFFARMFAALGLGSTSPAMPSESDRDIYSVATHNDKVQVPEGLTLLEQAEFLARHGQHQQAVAIYQSLDRQLQRRHAVLWNKIGIAYHQMLDMSAASKCYREALATDARYSEARNNLGTVHYTQKQYGRAIAEYKKSLEIFPGSASVHSNLGTAYFAQKKYEEASVHYARAVELDPKIFEHRGSQGTVLQQRNVEDRASFHFYLSKVYARNGDLERSLLYMRKALEEGFKDRRKFREDADFADLQDIPEFQTLLATEFRVL
jgi:tetratricopeptide (TPR) repeat protein